MAISKKEAIEILVNSLKDAMVDKPCKIYALKSAFNMGIIDFNKHKRLYEKHIED